MTGKGGLEACGGAEENTKGSERGSRRLWNEQAGIGQAKTGDQEIQ